MSPTILIVEDEPPLIEVLRYNLESAGFATLVATDGEDALLLAAEETPNLIVLDWMLPKLSGIDVCRRLREAKATKTVPIIMLTARGEEGDKISGLDAGADDYVVKPFSPSELIARVRAVLRRSDPKFGEEKLDYADITVDLVAHKVTRAGQPVHLGPTEYRLLQTLMERPTRVFSREQLLDLVWGRDIYVEERTVDVHVRRLRKALNETGGADLIRTIRRGGYSIDIG
ncbi:MAG: phosphate regulon transcriptional regulator PhoB [Rhodospirillaceae bacterium]|nr:phosphate regulon transcriptional regulator PhoB [Rhodospirillaceae bacterium]MBT4587890.1 phosphate regulon transcriptional regulator PhoB [Rhodospirillaceae bacterium]MBT4939113.1 phosphate regulon transcriptional regulator PhoB [Rhodospirillaceae bacterium]MBT5940785.1 phosphate regulon transcriptional regulator PhoB [Rhodospirillaceae bacterium]MBT7266617.1 phosphate regulon transcriptional regulator PhoB [Rhodospirillaceae bacterium]